MFPPRLKRTTRRGLTLAEMLVATAIMGMMAAALSTIALAVQMAHEFAAEQGVMAQHARVIVDRIQRDFSAATASETFPGAQVVTYYDSTYPFPQAIAIWRPETVAVDPAGWPRIDELKFFAADPDDPNRMLEFQATSDPRTAPTTNAGWQNLVEELINAEDVEKVELTDQLAAPKMTDGAVRSYSTLRFEMRVRPSLDEITDFRNGVKAWDTLRWPQRAYSHDSGTRQSWVAFQFQLAPDETSAERSSIDPEAAPFFGSAAIFYLLEQ
ncbi:PulJ/GspJ family protein [Blastopirellula retiformator]|uniref:Pseudopilin GspJ n=1 Tax=Blastopirellula retiformator TaxID=2527970 RepID=A0A5C5UYR1_9BACT|nr:prepilin-type N-terminal cleavage/methylation domain-containing protein [Blastopirellula retiformator]TWT31381.1 hypothetical protein Enr8_33020 [Blastopirellula retiformator]